MTSNSVDGPAESASSRRSFLLGLTSAGAGAIAAGSMLALPSSATSVLAEGEPAMLTRGDRSILIAAEIAEALAVTTYTHIVQSAPFFRRLASDDQGYLRAARQEEMSHYNLEHGLTASPSPYTTFYYPHGMFAKARVTLNTLVTLEDAFIAAYLVGVRNFSNPMLRVAAARIMGIESDHRTLARVVAPGVARMDGGPIERVVGINGTAESVDPPNNNGYERTLGWMGINQAVNALLPFVDRAAAGRAGFDTSRPYVFQPFAPVLPSSLGHF